MEERRRFRDYEWDQDTGTYLSATAFNEHLEHVLVMACTDPRFRAARGEFLSTVYGLDCYDPVIIPGGPRSLLLSSSHFWVARDWVKLLHSAHDFKRALLIAHWDCRDYKTKYPRLTDAERRLQQEKDLVAGIEELRKLVPGINVESFYCEPIHGRVKFTKIA